MRAELRRRLWFTLRALGIYCAAIVLFEYLLVVVYETLGTQTLGPVLQMLPPGIQALLGRPSLAKWNVARSPSS